jgi:acyl-CoA synthetase (AMP-forming)/AMP-acid ligase II
VAVLEAAVVGAHDPVYGEEVKAFVVLRPGYKVSERSLIDYCLKVLARYKAPKSVVFLDAMPKSPVGKILKRELRKMAAKNA